MSELIITRGYPGSGKTTWARAWVAEDPASRLRVNRDDLRHNLFGLFHGLTFEQEQTVTKVQHAAVDAALRAGRSVVVDDTNLRLRNARAWADLAVPVGATFAVRDLPVPVDECVRRDEARMASGGRGVGDAVIRGIAARFPLGRWPDVHPSTRAAQDAPAAYEPDPSLPSAWLVDIDGTLAHHGDRNVYDLTRVGEDTIDPVIGWLVDLLALVADQFIVVMSGRDESCRPATEQWLRDHGVNYSELHMRPAGDRREDFRVKADLFDEHVRHRWNVHAVLDDRDQVVRMWRGMGLKVLQVADGDF